MGERPAASERSMMKIRVGREAWRAKAQFTKEMQGNVMYTAQATMQFVGEVKRAAIFEGAEEYEMI
jgi:hypothetical protein